MPEPETPVMPLDSRNGACVACDCAAYAFERKMDGFATCVCAHTRWAHAKTFEAK